MVRKGSCNCGNITFTLNDDTTSAIVCHCKTCRRAGSSQSLNLQTTTAAVTVTSGDLKFWADTTTKSGQPLKRFFCGECGTPLWSDPDSKPGVRYLKVGTLEDKDARQTTLIAEVWCDQALPYQILPAQYGQKQIDSNGKPYTKL